MKAFLLPLAVVAALAVNAAHAGSLAPAPRVVAKCDRNFIERSGAQTLEELLDTGIIRYFLTGGPGSFKEGHWLRLVSRSFGFRGSFRGLRVSGHGSGV